MTDQEGAAYRAARITCRSTLDPDVRSVSTQEIEIAAVSSGAKSSSSMHSREIAISTRRSDDGSQQDTEFGEEIEVGRTGAHSTDEALGLEGLNKVHDIENGIKIKNIEVAGANETGSTQIQKDPVGDQVPKAGEVRGIEKIPEIEKINYRNRNLGIEHPTAARAPPVPKDEGRSLSEVQDLRLDLLAVLPSNVYGGQFGLVKADNLPIDQPEASAINSGGHTVSISFSLPWLLLFSASAQSQPRLWDVVHRPCSHPCTKPKVDMATSSPCPSFRVRWPLGQFSHSEKELFKTSPTSTTVLDLVFLPPFLAFCLLLPL